MTPEQFIQDLRSKAEQIILENKPFAIAVRTSIALTTQRIFADGENSSGSNIGSYDTSRPLYINPDKSPRTGADKPKGVEGLKKAGKNGDTKFKNGNDHKTAFVNNYKDFRNRIGRRIDVVNLNLTGQLQSDFANAETAFNQVAKIDENRFKVDANTYEVTLKNAFNIKKKKGLEEKYGTIFQPTEQEKNTLARVADFELNKLLNA
jgi:hypothetical protein